MKNFFLLASLATSCCLAPLDSTFAQVAGSSNTTVVGITVTETNEVALGWSAKKSILGKIVYNDSGEKLGVVEDLIIAPEKNVSYVIIGAGGFIGMNRHDVAIPVSQLRDGGGKIVMHGATKDAVKAMPGFKYADDSIRRDQFLLKADQDIAKAKEKIAELQKKSAALAGEAKTNLDQQISTLQADLKAADARLVSMKQAGAKKWKELQADTAEAFARLLVAVEKATG